MSEKESKKSGSGFVMGGGEEREHGNLLA